MFHTLVYSVLRGCKDLMSKRKTSNRDKADVIKDIISRAISKRFKELDIPPDDWNLELTEHGDDCSYLIVLGEQFVLSPHRKLGLDIIEADLRLLIEDTPSQVAH